MKRNPKIRVFRKTPFAWQEKKILRAIQKAFTKRQLPQAVSVYTTLTQIASNSESDKFSTYRIKISEMSGVGVDTLKEILIKFQRMGLVNFYQERNTDGTFGTIKIELLSPLSSFTDTVNFRRKSASIENNIRNNSIPVDNFKESSSNPIYREWLLKGQPGEFRNFVKNIKLKKRNSYMGL